ncbi:MAG TPA: hypothetical protein VHT91_32230 [Kofleriaceae bacterium]|nr:hypothetical protein [Kofleriaceae bacterium]
MAITEVDRWMIQQSGEQRTSPSRDRVDQPRDPIDHAAVAGRQESRPCKALREVERLAQELAFSSCLAQLDQ